ncbi:ATP-dependent DNA helicase sgs1, partial [Coemansia sp. RSA 2337]
MAIDLCSDFEGDLEVIDAQDFDDAVDFSCSATATTVSPKRSGYMRGQSPAQKRARVSRSNARSISASPNPSIADDVHGFYLDEVEPYYGAIDSDHDDLLLIEEGDDVAFVLPQKETAAEPKPVDAAATFKIANYDSLSVEERLTQLAIRKANISDEICDLEFANEIANDNDISLCKQDRAIVINEINRLKSMVSLSVLPPADSPSNNSSRTVQAAQPSVDTLYGSHALSNGGNALWANEPVRQPTLAARNVADRSMAAYQPATNAEIVKPSDPDPNQQQVNYHWTKDVYKALRQVFKMKEFRSRQLEAINATLQGKDVFVLMPTGGGKSLCFQLPAIVQKGNTRGVTVVVSPLLSLMQDQIEHLVGWGVAALSLTGTMPADRRAQVFREIDEPEPRLRL